MFPKILRCPLLQYAIIAIYICNVNRLFSAPAILPHFLICSDSKNSARHQVYHKSLIFSLVEEVSPIDALHYHTSRLAITLAFGV